MWPVWFRVGKHQHWSLKGFVSQSGGPYWVLDVPLAYPCCGFADLGSMVAYASCGEPCLVRPPAWEWLPQFLACIKLLMRAQNVTECNAMQLENVFQSLFWPRVPFLLPRAYNASKEILYSSYAVLVEPKWKLKGTSQIDNLATK